MSATRDQSQKVSFVYSNLYQIYQKGKAEAIAAEVPNSGAVIKAAEVSSLSGGQLPAESPKPFAVNPRSHILKTKDLRDPSNSMVSSVKVAEYNPTAFIGKRVARPGVIPPVAQQPTAAINSLKENLKSLNDLHSRLRFMLQELEELVKK
jgi:hypothetical protein